MAERIYCSDLARAAEAPMHGTAVHVDMWLLLEYPRPWKPKALLDNDLPDHIIEHLDALPEALANAGIKLRVQFIKQASSADIERPRAFLADGRVGRVRLVSVALPGYSSFGAIRPEDLLEGGLPGAAYSEEELLLVCTNGQRDLCCARFGLPLFESLAFRYGSRVWQTTHVGGHRYAPNLLCLPSGIVYGHVHADAGVALVERHDAGELVLENLRGRAGFSASAQAAEYFVRREMDARVGDVEITPATELRYRWRCDGRAGNVSLAEVALGEIVASCGAAPKQEHAYELIEFEKT